MALKTVKYVTTNCIDCAFAFPAEVILCVTASKVAPHLCPDGVSEQTWEYNHIEAILTDVSKPCNSSYYTYTFSYDDALLNAGEILYTSDILGIFCKGCESTYFEDLIGDEIQFTVEEDGSVTITSQHGCTFNFFPSEGTLAVEDTESVDLTLTGGLSKTLSADVKISADAGNEIEIRADGLFADFTASFVPLSDDSTDLGTDALRFRNLYLSDSIRFANDTYAQWRNVANSAWVDVIKLDSLDDVILNASTGNEIRFTQAGVEQWGISSAGELEQNAVGGGDLVFSLSDSVIRLNTLDGADNKRLLLTSGGSITSIEDRGASLDLRGNEYLLSPGSAILQTGADDSDSALYFILNGTDSVAEFQNSALNILWKVDAVNGNLEQGAADGGPIVFTKTDGIIRQNTNNGSDTKAIRIYPASAEGYDRSGSIDIYGDDHATRPGDVIVTAGNGGEVELWAGNGLGWYLDASQNWRTTAGYCLVQSLVRGVVVGGNSPSSFGTNTALTLFRDPTSGTFIGMGCFGDHDTGVNILAYKNRGTSFPLTTEVNNGDELFNLEARGMGTAGVYRVAGQLRILADGAAAAAAVPGRIEFLTALAGSAIRRWYIDSEGLLSNDSSNGGSIQCSRIGTGVRIAEGANARMGQATLVAGTVTVVNTSITANTRIFLSRNTVGGMPGFLDYTLIASTSFTINSTNVLDTSVVNWLLIEAV